jgi:hypothetical protein
MLAPTASIWLNSDGYRSYPGHGHRGNEKLFAESDFGAISEVEIGRTISYGVSRKDLAESVRARNDLRDEAANLHPPLTDSEWNEPKVALGSPDAIWPLMATTLATARRLIFSDC